MRLILLLWLTLAPKIVSVPFPHSKTRATSDNIVVIHYDSSETVRETIRYLKRKRNAYHYVIGKDGVIYKLIDPKYEARHAGLSYWHGYLRLNHYSIGICLSGSGTVPYTDAQYASLNWLLSSLRGQYPDIDSTKIVGHSDIAFPRGRKQDPGPNFDWMRIWNANTAGTQQATARLRDSSAVPMK
jgi:N-acetylmuramoyl-L-alanine amidase